MKAVLAILPALLLLGCGGLADSPTLAPSASEPIAQSHAVERQACFETVRSSIDFTPQGGHYRLVWHDNAEKHFKLRQYLTYGTNDNPGSAQVNIQNDTCNVFNAPEPSGGTAILYMQFSGCLQSCPDSIDFLKRDKSMFRIFDSQLLQSELYSIYLFTNGNSAPAEVISAKGITGGIEFATPFQSPLKLNPAENFYLEIVQNAE